MPPADQFNHGSAVTLPELPSAIIFRNSFQRRANEIIVGTASQKKSEGVRQVARALAAKPLQMQRRLFRLRRWSRVRSRWRLSLLQLLLLLRVPLN
jgi:hypothetical protein